MSAAAHRIGPNAITRVAEALRPRVGAAVTVKVFGRAGLLAYLAEPPAQMVDEAEVTRLHHELRATLGHDLARTIAREAGMRTGDYLLAHRIPKPVQTLLLWLPAPLAARVLLSAIRRHAWTFAGSGFFTARAGRPVVLTLKDNPLCRGAVLTEPACDYYAATFERLFCVLVHPRARALEVACEAMGAEACVFEIRW
ncbi:bacteriochlorophyll 4-vinyl reductase [Ideonella sp. A 288]|uniref:bacteriochlorophyll 4-vinyl reductase n=1 Tax=Ideonella sp. A 288 TaxID=1962181 RepID=UPI000B4B8E8B|nr:bacteriochlorophyll 4-vinyl reductase [Ideonella sp. A 288]